MARCRVNRTDIKLFKHTKKGLDVGFSEMIKGPTIDSIFHTPFSATMKFVSRSIVTQDKEESIDKEGEQGWLEAPLSLVCANEGIHLPILSVFFGRVKTPRTSRSSNAV